MKYIGSSLLLFFFSLKGYCQNELKNWYFGTGTDGISFVNNVPQKLSNKLSGVGYEGMIVLNDPLTGDLLFYSDGIRVVNKNHVIMPNGSGLTGHVSGAQCVQCCPVPGSCAKRFYLFTNSAFDNTQGKISYSIVDFTADPLGTVTNKNTLFWNGPSDQGMCLVNKPNSNDYWLIANSFTTAAYNVWPLTSTGIGTPVTYTFSNLGSSYVINYDKGTGKLTVGGGGSKVLTMLDFDANTGILSNEVQMAPGFYAAGASRFSPDGTKLYSGMSPTSSDRPRLYQYDFSTAAWTDMNSCCYAHDLKLGPDNKMYFIHTYNSNQPLGVIDFPNRTAVGNACNYHTLTFTPAFNGEVRRFPETVILPTPVTANSDSARLINNSITIPVLANDSASLHGTFFIDTVITAPLHGTAVISGNDIVYTAAPNTCGITDTFTYRIKNQDCATDTATVRVSFPSCVRCTNAVISNDTTVCEGAKFTLSAEPGDLSYSWTPSAGLSDTSVQNPTLTARDTATYYLTTKHLSSNLVVNGDFEQGNTGFSTGYIYSSPSPLAPPGHYTVAPSITNNWFANCADHTPTGANNMLLVDGANGSSGVPVGTMLWCETVTVTPNTGYAFSTWLTNLNAGGATSQLRFSINGMQVGTVQNTPLGTCQWNQFYVLWNSGASSAANICISEAGGAQPGNDLAIDDIFFGETFSCTDSVKITVTPAEHQNVQAAICAGQQYILPSGVAVTSTGIYNDTLRTIPGCDSIVTTQLTVSPQSISFTAPDTVCLNTPVNIVNTSACASSYYWSFCSADINSTIPGAVNLGNPGNFLSGPTFSDYVKDANGNYYLFVTNFSSGNLVRLAFGTNLLNTPTAVNLGNFGGRLIPGGTEGIQVVYNENKWYAIITVGRINSPATAGLVKLEFGSAVTNTSPSVTVWNNIGGLNYPCDITMFQQYGNWYGLVLNKSGNSISRFNFSNSFNNTPVGVNLGNIGNLNNPTGIYAIYDNGNWYAFITNSYQDDPSRPNDGTITRIDFGTSLLNTPVGINLGNPGGLLNNVRDIYIVKTCGNQVGFVVNWNSNDIVKLDFHNAVTSTPTAVSLGNIGQLQTPHSISKFFRVENDLYSFATNLGNSITRFRFAGCTGINIPGSSAYNPPPVTYSSPGRYTINLVTDDSLPTQSSFCREIVVTGNDFVKTGGDTAVCAGTSLHLTATGAKTYSWKPANGLSDPAIADPVVSPVNNDVQYIVTGTSSTGCTANDTINITAKPLPVVKINSDTVFCKGGSVPLNSTGAATYSWEPATGLSSTSVPDPVAAPVTSYQYIVTGTSAGGCSAKDTVDLTMLPLPVITKTSDTSICKNTSVRVFAGGGDHYQWSSTGGIDNPLLPNPVVTPAGTTVYYVMVTDTNNCVNNDSVKISFRPDPVFTVSPNQQACTAKPAQLKAGGGDTYSWSPAASVSNTSAPDPLTDIAATTDFSVLITESTCHTDTTLFTTVTVLSPPHVTASKTNDIDCSNGSAKLLAEGADSYSWAPATALTDATVANPVASPPNTQQYIVTGTDTDGCSGYDTITVTANYIGNPSGYYMPNAFTPNGDGRNECYGIKYWGFIKHLQFYIYDRWGNIVFYTANPADCWDGTYKGQPAGIGGYSYYIKAVTACGAVERKGMVVLSR